MGRKTGKWDISGTSTDGTCFLLVFDRTIVFDRRFFFFLVNAYAVGMGWGVVHDKSYQNTKLSTPIMLPCLLFPPLALTRESGY